MIVASSGRLELRAYEGSDRDETLLTGWLSDSRVLQWFEGRDRPHDLAMVRQHYGTEALAAGQVQAAIIHDDTVPLGYLRWYPMTTVVDEYDWRDDPTDVWAADIFVGEPSRWGSGLGSSALALLVEHLMVTEGARRVVVDPWVGNARAIRAYEKIGFRTVGIHRGHELFEGVRRDCWLMAIDALDHPVGLSARLTEPGAAGPYGAPSAHDRDGIVRLVADWARHRGLDVHLDEVSPGLRNVVVVRRGSGGGRSLLLSARLGTAGAPVAPVHGVRLGVGRLEGPRALSTMGGLAVALLAAASFAEGELAGDLIVAGVVDDEHTSIGSEALVARWKADGAVALEPTGGAVVCRHRGIEVLEVSVTGRPARTSQPERGVSAVGAAARAVAALEALDARWSAAATDPVFRPAVMVTGVRSEGEAFAVPARCVLTVELRTTSLVTASEVAPVTEAITWAAAPASVSVTTVHTRRPMQMRESHRLAEQACAAVADVAGASAQATSASNWTRAAILARAGIPAVVCGPPGDDLDDELEWVSTEGLHRCVAVLRTLARNWCAPR